jgi:DnaJ domain
MAYAVLADAGNGSLFFASSYDAGLQADFKATTAPHLRAWDAGNKRWLIDPSIAGHVAALCEYHLGVTPAIPPLGAAAAVKQVRLVRVLYIGTAKWRADNSYTASGYVEDEHGQGRWGLVFPVGVLRSYFEGGLSDLFSELAQDDEWSLLGLDRDKAATYSENDIKAAARKAKAMAHPDRHGSTREAHEYFLRVQEAGELLADPFARHISITGAVEVEKDRQAKLHDYASAGRISYTYQPPATGRTGWFLVEGAPLLGDRQFLVSKIVRAEEIMDDLGRVLTARIPRGERTPVPHWLEV